MTETTTPTVALERITPEDAGVLLAANDHNRNIRPPRVTQLANAIRRGEWEVNGQTLKVAANGTLIDGQHRLHAVMESGIPIETLVMRDLPPEVQDTVDTGRKRRLADILKIEGYRDTHALAAAVNILYRYRSGLRIDYSQAGAPSPPQAMELIAKEPQIVDSVKMARVLAKHLHGPIGVFSAMHCVFVQVDPEPAEEFFEKLKLGEELAKGDPVLHLRGQLNRPQKDRGYTQSPATVTGLICKAFNLRREGRRVNLLTFRKNEKIPPIDPPAQRLEIDG